MRPDGELDPKRRRLCRGWADEMARRFMDGGIVVDPAERESTHRALMALIAFEDGIKAGDDSGCTRAMEVLDRPAMRILGSVFKRGLFG
jgi:hypothetical protein